MFTEKAQAVIDTAKDTAFADGKTELEMAALLSAMVSQPQACLLLADCLKMEPDNLKACLLLNVKPASCPQKLPLSTHVRSVLKTASSMAQEIPDPHRPGLIDIRHIAAALAASPSACEMIHQTPISQEDGLKKIAEWLQQDSQNPALSELLDRIRKMRGLLLERLFGQDHAVQAFVEGVFNAEVTAAADSQRRCPRAVFVFAGPPGVGKTFLAELGAACLDRPFKRFDMSAYSGHQQNEALVGIARSFQGAHPGLLTEFVEKNPEAVLLFDEIEKAHQNTIFLFLQILDAGSLEDKYHERPVSFRDTTIIFTTNAGKTLYNRPNQSGVHTANAAFHRQTILDALKTEKDPQTGLPFFPEAICSRMGTGYPILFNHLGINELEQVVRNEFRRVCRLLERQYYKNMQVDELVPICLVLREGARADARTLRSGAERFVKTEIFNFCRLFKTERLEDIFEQVDSVQFALESSPDFLEPEVRRLFLPEQKPCILLAADAKTCQLFQKHLTQIDWQTAENAQEALQILAEKDVDLVILDIWMGESASPLSPSLKDFDHVPAAARRLDKGQELLRKIRERLPNIPIYLLSLVPSDQQSEPVQTTDEELLFACVRGGGARGMIACGFLDEKSDGWEQQQKLFESSLLDTARRLHREKQAALMAREHKVLAFDTVPRMNHQTRTITIVLRNLRIRHAIAAADAGEILDEVQRPRTRFEEVIGAQTAKEELLFFIDYLKNPRRFAAMGLKAPKGVLLYGPPGTGKTMLARAMAGESNAAFLPVSATNFVTIWQGSGPQNIRDLFARARRYAPAIIFIDEIDAIGKVRLGGPGGRAEENTLNALLTEMDGFTSESPEQPVFVLAATNFSIDGGAENAGRTLDPALVRRFSRTILVDLPERAARLEYLRLRVQTCRNCRISTKILDSIAERSSGLSIAHLETILETASRTALKAGRPLTDAILEETFESVRFGQARPRSADEVRRTAYHEAGHAILYWQSGQWPAYLSVVSRGKHGGYMDRSSEDIESTRSQSRPELMAEIRAALGGRAAEILLFGPESGLSTGASADLEAATRLARAAVCCYGMTDEFGLLAAPELLKYEAALGSPLYQKVNEIVQTLLARQMQMTFEILKNHRGHLDSLAQALISRERLSRDEVRQILPEPPISASDAIHSNSSST
ncbi:MAG TPA: AAA family ATPase [Anaerohalosphaeraceae bacterium]|nr:AAA family ATPase [Anaerohalosphaeraceae bacterium]